jgi:hypothetical protein
MNEHSVRIKEPQFLLGKCEKLTQALMRVEKGGS